MWLHYSAFQAEWWVLDMFIQTFEVYVRLKIKQNGSRENSFYDYLTGRRTNKAVVSAWSICAKWSLPPLRMWNSSPISCPYKLSRWLATTDCDCAILYSTRQTLFQRYTTKRILFVFYIWEVSNLSNFDIRYVREVPCLLRVRLSDMNKDTPLVSFSNSDLTVYVPAHQSTEVESVDPDLLECLGLSIFDIAMMIP